MHQHCRDFGAGRGCDVHGRAQHRLAADAPAGPARAARRIFPGVMCTSVRARCARACQLDVHGRAHVPERACQTGPLLYFYLFSLYPSHYKSCWGVRRWARRAAKLGGGGNAADGSDRGRRGRCGGSRPGAIAPRCGCLSGRIASRADPDGDATGCGSGYRPSDERRRFQLYSGRLK